MTLTEIRDALLQQGVLPPSRVKDLNTSLRYLARAMDATPETLTNAETLQPRYQPILRAFFANLQPTPSRHTVRNTMNNLSIFFRAAHTCSLLNAFTLRPPRKKINNALRREAALTSPYANRLKKQSYLIRPKAWPANIRQGWTAYSQAANLTSDP